MRSREEEAWIIGSNGYTHRVRYTHRQWKNAANESGARAEYWARSKAAAVKEAALLHKFGCRVNGIDEVCGGQWKEMKPHD